MLIVNIKKKKKKKIYIYIYVLITTISRYGAGQRDLPSTWHCRKKIFTLRMRVNISNILYGIYTYLISVRTGENYEITCSIISIDGGYTGWLGVVRHMAYESLI